MAELCNPLLYQMLTHQFGEVKVRAPGRPIQWKLVYEDASGHKSERPRRRVFEAGEEFHLKCPRCLDYKPRLSINHMWGVWDPGSETRNLWMANCYNCQGFSEYDAQQVLFDQICTAQRYRNKDYKLRVNPVTTTREVIERVEPPGLLARLDTLAKTDPYHPAVDYLFRRGFNVFELGRKWQVSYCFSSNVCNYAVGRIIIPCFYQGMMVYWQARYVGDDVHGKSFKEARVAKYLSSCPRHGVVYNFDRAVQHSTVVLVEGPADAWAVGPQAIALFGKSLDERFRKQLGDAMRKHEDPVVIVALDPEQDEGERRRGAQHHLDKAVTQLQRGRLAGRVVPLYVPLGYDPGSMERDWFRYLAKREARKWGLEANFRRPMNGARGEKEDSASGPQGLGAVAGSAGPK